jgi:hypothetical protein
MASTISKPRTRNPLRRSTRSPGAVYFPDGATPERPMRASPGATSVSGVKAISPALLALSPLGLAFGWTLQFIGQSL